MSTPCLIGLKQGNTVQYISCHWDGYLSWAGIILQLGYTDVQKVQDLITLGDLHSIGYNIAPPRHFNNAEQAMNYGVYMNWHILTTFCLAYYRDLGHSAFNCGTKSNTYDEFVSMCNRDYGYYFDIDIKQWCIVYKQKVFLLGQVLSIKKLYSAYQRVTSDFESWESLSDRVYCNKMMLEQRKGYSIIATYNDWLQHHPKYRSSNIKFGYATIGGKRVYALWSTKVQQEQKRRKPIRYSDCIGDLVAYLEAHY